MKRVAFFYFLLFLSLSSAVQIQAKPWIQLPKLFNFVDSSKSKVDSQEKKHLKHKKFIQSVDTLSMSEYMMSIDRVNDDLIELRDSAKLGLKVVKLKRRIDAISNDFDKVKLNFKDRHSRLSLRNLYLYEVYVTKMDDENDRIMDDLQKMYLRIYHAKLRVKTVTKDSVFRVLYADSMLRNTFDDKLARLEWRWQAADSVTKLNLDSINTIKMKAIDNSLNLTNMMSLLNFIIDRTDERTFSREFNYLWEKDKNYIVNKYSSSHTISQLSSEQKALGFYIGETWTERIFILIFGLLVFLWLFMKRKLLKAIREQKEKYEFLKLQYVNRYPFLLLLVILLCLMPFFDAYAPALYIFIEYFILIAAATVILLGKLKRSVRFDWLALTILFVMEALTYLLLEPTIATRMWMLVQHSAILVFIYRFNKKTNRQAPYASWINAAAIVGMIFVAAAIIMNILGRFTLSSGLGLAGIFATTMAVVLTIFIEGIIEMILLQLLNSRLKKGVDKPFDSSIVIKRIKVPILIAACIIWFIMLTSSLNMYNSLSDSIVNGLTSTRNIGSMSFKLISVLMFFVIIWFAHILQRLLSFLFGETGVDAEDTTTITKGQHSRLLITRLLVLIGGYLLAIAASGLPIDKLTFVLGALGIGIGMGLQSIVNNFVSGIILIFGGALQIGDEIEVSGQAGKVKEIGLRASTLSTSDGAEVIIPNGIILSQNIVNWTFSNDQKRVVIGFSLKGEELDANLINDIINETIQNIPNVIENRKPVILYTKVTQESCTLTVRFWSTISNTDSVQSDAMLNLNAAFKAKKIGFE